MSQNNTLDNVQVIKKQTSEGDIEIRILRDKCISAATCTVYSPNTFDLDETDIAIIKNGEWDRLEKIINGAESCPVFAIEVFLNNVKIYPKGK